MMIDPTDPTLHGVYDRIRMVSERLKELEERVKELEGQRFKSDEAIVEVERQMAGLYKAQADMAILIRVLSEKVVEENDD